MTYMAPLGNSDHSVIYAKCNFQCNYRVIADKLNYNKGDYASLRQSLSIDWDLLFEPYSNDGESMWNIYLKKKLLLILLSSFPWLRFLNARLVKIGIDLYQMMSETFLKKIKGMEKVSC
jgi:hypothetical protein